MSIAIDLLVYIALGALLSWYFYYYRKKDLLGGFTGALIVGVLGSILGAFSFSLIVSRVLELLQKGLHISNVNIVAAAIGGYLAVYIYNKINHDRTRKE